MHIPYQHWISQIDLVLLVLQGLTVLALAFTSALAFKLAFHVTTSGAHPSVSDSAMSIVTVNMDVVIAALFAESMLGHAWMRCALTINSGMSDVISVSCISDILYGAALAFVLLLTIRVCASVRHTWSNGLSWLTYRPLGLVILRKKWLPSAICHFGILDTPHCNAAVYTAEATHRPLLSDQSTYEQASESTVVDTSQLAGQTLVDQHEDVKPPRGDEIRLGDIMRMIQKDRKERRARRREQEEELARVVQEKIELAGRISEQSRLLDEAMRVQTDMNDNCEHHRRRIQELENFNAELERQLARLSAQLDDITRQRDESSNAHEQVKLAKAVLEDHVVEQAALLRRTQKENTDIINDTAERLKNTAKELQKMKRIAAEKNSALEQAKKDNEAFKDECLALLDAVEQEKILLEKRAADNAKEAHEARQELDTSKKVHSADVEAFRGERAELLQANDALKKEHDDLSKTVNDLKDERDRLTRAVNGLESENFRLKCCVEEQTDVHERAVAQSAANQERNIYYFRALEEMSRDYAALQKRLREQSSVKVQEHANIQNEGIAEPKRSQLKNDIVVHEHLGAHGGEEHGKRQQECRTSHIQVPEGQLQDQRASSGTLRTSAVIKQNNYQNAVTVLLSPFQSPQKRVRPDGDVLHKQSPSNTQVQPNDETESSSSAVDHSDMQVPQLRIDTAPSMLVDPASPGFDVCEDISHHLPPPEEYSDNEDISHHLPPPEEYSDEEDSFDIASHLPPVQSAANSPCVRSRQTLRLHDMSLRPDGLGDISFGGLLAVSSMRRLPSSASLNDAGLDDLSHLPDASGCSRFNLSNARSHDSGLNDLSHLPNASGCSRADVTPPPVDYSAARHNLEQYVATLARINKRMIALARGEVARETIATRSSLVNNGKIATPSLSRSASFEIGQIPTHLKERLVDECLSGLSAVSSTWSIPGTGSKVYAATTTRTTETGKDQSDHGGGVDDGKCNPSITTHAANTSVPDNIRLDADVSLFTSSRLEIPSRLLGKLVDASFSGLSAVSSIWGSPTSSSGKDLPLTTSYSEEQEVKDLIALPPTPPAKDERIVAAKMFDNNHSTYEEQEIEHMLAVNQRSPQVSLKSVIVVPDHADSSEAQVETQLLDKPGNGLRHCRP